MKTLKTVLVILFIACFPLNIQAKRKPCHVKVSEFQKPYSGKCSWFRVDKTSAINPNAENYVAMRWDYKKLANHWGFKGKKSTTKVVEKLKSCWVLVKNPETGKKTWGKPADWGPAAWTGRIIDLDPDIMEDLECETDDRLVATLYEKKPLFSWFY